MRFVEHGTFSIPFEKQSLIYFLLDGDEVVYVGKTKLGLARPMQHIHSKVFDDIEVLHCDECDLDELESKFILKYKPKYNRIINPKAYVQLLTARNKLREMGVTDYTLPLLKKDAKKLHIDFVEFNGTPYIHKHDINRLYEFICTTDKAVWE